MTNGKAIEVLIRARKIISPVGPLHEALGLAIKMMKAASTDRNVNDTISKQEAIAAIEAEKTRRGDYLTSSYVGYEIAEKVVAKLPPAEPRRMRGRWVGADTQCGIACSVCGVAVDDFCHSADYIDLDYNPDFCPNCGADMREEQNGKSER